MAKRRKRSNGKKKARRSNPRKKRRNSTPSWARSLMGKKSKKRRNPRRGHARRRHNPTHRRRRRHNPGTFDVLKHTAIAALAGIGVGLAGTVLVNGALSTASPSVKTGALAALAAGAAAMVGPTHPAMAAGIATGLVLVPGQQLLASILPPALLGLPAASASAAPAPPATSGLGLLYPIGVKRPAMGLLYPRGIGGMGDRQVLNALGIKVY